MPVFHICRKLARDFAFLANRRGQTVSENSTAIAESIVKVVDAW